MKNKHKFQWGAFIMGVFVMFIILSSAVYIQDAFGESLLEKYDALLEETHRVMPDEITPLKGEECFETRTVEYFKGFDKSEFEKELDSNNTPTGFIMVVHQPPTDERTYCVKVHEVRTVQE